MGTHAAPANGRQLSTWPLYRAMVGVGLVCGLMIVVIFEITRPVIAANQAAALEAAIFKVLPGTSTRVTFVEVNGTFAPLETSAGVKNQGEHVHAAYDASGNLVGLAVEASGTGYQDTIRLLYGFSPRQHAIVGLEVLESKETPGLGDRIETDPRFLANFEHLDVALEGAAIRHPIVVVPSGSKAMPWQIDGITGATISSKAIAEMLRRSTATWVPTLEQRVGDFSTNKPTDLESTTKRNGEANSDDPP